MAISKRQQLENIRKYIGKKGGGTGSKTAASQRASARFNNLPQRSADVPF